jgi:hypothetical protein
MAAYVAALFGVGLLRRRSFLSGLKRPEKPNSIEIFYCLQFFSGTSTICLI